MISPGPASGRNSTKEGRATPDVPSEPPNYVQQHQMDPSAPGLTSTLRFPREEANPKGSACDLQQAGASSVPELLGHSQQHKPCCGNQHSSCLLAQGGLLCFSRDNCPCWGKSLQVSLTAQHRNTRSCLSREFFGSPSCSKQKHEAAMQHARLSRCWAAQAPHCWDKPGAPLPSTANPPKSTFCASPELSAAGTGDDLSSRGAVSIQKGACTEGRAPSFPSTTPPAASWLGRGSPAGRWPRAAAGAEHPECRAPGIGLEVLLRGGGCANMKLCMSLGNCMTQTSQQCFCSLPSPATSIHAQLRSPLPAGGLWNTTAWGCSSQRLCLSLQGSTISPQHIFPLSHTASRAHWLCTTKPPPHTAALQQR